MVNTILAILASILMNTASPKVEFSQPFQAENVMAERAFSMSNRYSNQFVNDVFRDNMLLTLNFMKNGRSNQPINWDEVLKPLHYELELKPAEVFAFHDGLLPEYKNKSVVTTNAHFNASEGFKSSGLLYGDGVCQLASLINWTAKDAGLEVKSLVNHDFARIPDVPREYGVSIYAYPGESSRSIRQNLYITNNKAEPVKFVFHYDGEKLNVSVKKS